MKYKINIIATGGAGLNLSNSVFRDLSELGDGFADMTFSYIDTSKNNVSMLEENEDEVDFFQIESEDYGDNAIAGSGSDRRSNSKAIMSSVKTYLNERKINKHIAGEYYVVVCSGSGGSGSVVAPNVVKELLGRDIPVIAVVVGDSGTGLSAMNTIDTLATFDSIAKKAKKPLSMVYVNNQAYNKGSKANAEKDADKALFNTLASISLFLSGINGDLDYQDMMNFVDQSNYSKLNIKPGVYGLLSFSGVVKIPEGCIPTIARSLTVEGHSPDIDVTLLHHKSGMVLEENAISIYEEQFPIHLVTYANFLTMEQRSLKKVVDDYKNIMESIEVDAIEGTSEADEDGMVF